MDESENTIFDRLAETHAQKERFDAGIALSNREKIKEKIDTNRAINVAQSIQEVLEKNATRPVRIRSIEVKGGSNTRDSFLAHHLSPLLNNKIAPGPKVVLDTENVKDSPLSKNEINEINEITAPTFETVLSGLDLTAHRLASFGIYDSISYSLDLAMPPPSQIGISSDPQDTINLNAKVYLHEAKRLLLSTGTDIGNSEAQFYVSGLLRNALGGGESLSLNVSRGTRTRSTYLASFSSPIFNSSDWKATISANSCARSLDFASHELVLNGLTTKISGTLLKSSPLPKNVASTSPLDILGRPIITTEFGAEAVSRTVTGLSPSASETVKQSAGTSTKISLFGNASIDTRNDKLIPSSGFLLRLSSELANTDNISTTTKSSLKNLLSIKKANDNCSPFAKISADSLVALGLHKDDVVFSLSARGGLLYPLNSTKGSLLPDRFFLGGPNDVRGFYTSRLGPRDGPDSIGGEAFLAGGASVITRVPTVPRSSPLRLQGFINAGGLSGWKSSKSNESLKLNGSNIIETFKDLIENPSISTGFGLVYKHPAARFELNFCLPLSIRRGDDARKGLQFGVGLEFF